MRGDTGAVGVVSKLLRGNNGDNVFVFDIVWRVADEFVITGVNPLWKWLNNKNVVYDQSSEHKKWTKLKLQKNKTMRRVDFVDAQKPNRNTFMYRVCWKTKENKKWKQKQMD